MIAVWSACFPDPAPRNDPAFVIDQYLQRQGDLFFVAADPGAGDAGVIGAVLGGYDGHRGWVYSLGVSPAHRRRGVAKALMQRLEAGLAALGCPKTNLQVLPENRQVVALYESLGFRVEERISMGKRIEDLG